MFSKCPNPVRFALTYVKDTESQVIPNLAFDLPDLEELRKKGRPISLDNAASIYYDGQPMITPVVPLERQRGTDINDVWNASLEGDRLLTKAGIRRVDFQKIGG